MSTVMLARTSSRQFNKWQRNQSVHMMKVAAARHYTFDSLSGGDGGGGGGYGGGGMGIYLWPRSTVNTGVCVCAEGERMVIERFGKMVDVKGPGIFFAIPFVDRIAYRVDMRESAIEIPPQTTITKDNVSVDVSGCIYIQFVDPLAAAYGNSNPIYAVTQFAQSTMRAAIGSMELDEILHARRELNTIIQSTVQDSATPWGLKVLRYEITEISPDRKIREAMDKQAAAERTRREKVLGAEGSKQTVELSSQGFKIKVTNESEGERIKTENEAKAMKFKQVLEAEGEAEAIKLRAAANAEAVLILAGALQAQGGSEAATLGLAKEYVAMYGEMGAKSNTMLFQDRPGDLNALLAQAATVLATTSHSHANQTSLLQPPEPPTLPSAATEGNGEDAETDAGADSFSSETPRSPPVQ